MRRINSGLYTETRSVMVDGKEVQAEFQVFKIKTTDPKNPKKEKTLPLWSWDCPPLKILTRDVYGKKQEAMNALDRACGIGFKNVSLNAVMLAVV